MAATEGDEPDRGCAAHRSDLNWTARRSTAPTPCTPRASRLSPPHRLARTRESALGQYARRDLNRRPKSDKMRGE
jgi:hypothetical protein